MSKKGPNPQGGQQKKKIRNIKELNASRELVDGGCRFNIGKKSRCTEVKKKHARAQRKGTPQNPRPSREEDIDVGEKMLDRGEKRPFPPDPEQRHQPQSITGLRGKGEALEGGEERSPRKKPQTSEKKSSMGKGCKRNLISVRRNKCRFLREKKRGYGQSEKGGVVFQKGSDVAGRPAKEEEKYASMGERDHL